MWDKVVRTMDRTWKWLLGHVDMWVKDAFRQCRHALGEFVRRPAALFAVLFLLMGVAGGGLCWLYFAVACGSWAQAKTLNDSYAVSARNVRLRWLITAILFAVLSIVAFAFIYRDHSVFDDVTMDFWSSLYFSVVTWSTLGIGDLQPDATSHAARTAVAIESVLGAGSIALFVGHVLNIMNTSPVHLDWASARGSKLEADLVDGLAKSISKPGADRISVFTRVASGWKHKWDEAHYVRYFDAIERAIENGASYQRMFFFRGSKDPIKMLQGQRALLEHLKRAILLGEREKRLVQFKYVCAETAGWLGVSFALIRRGMSRTQLAIYFQVGQESTGGIGLLQFEEDLGALAPSMMETTASRSFQEAFEKYWSGHGAEEDQALEPVDITLEMIDTQLNQKGGSV